MVLRKRNQIPKGKHGGWQLVLTEDVAHLGKQGETVIYTVTDIAEDKVVVDGNHSLAGQTLNFQCVVSGVRVATGEELTHGHVHGAHGHHH